MSEAQNDNDKFVSAIAIAGASVPIVEGIVALSNGGVIGGIVGLGVSGLVWLAADEMAKKGRGLALPAPALQPQRTKKPGQPNAFQRMFTGKADREEYEQGDDEKTPDNDGYYVQIGPKLFIHIDDLLSNRIAILGMPGMGKSNAVTKFCEGIAPFEPPIVIYDSKPEYTQLCQEPYFVNPYRVNASNLSPERAKEFGIYLMENRLQAVVNLPSYQDDDLAAKVMIGINAGIKAYETALNNERGSNEDCLPVLVVLDEAHIWLPQSGAQSVVSKEKDPQTGKSLFTRLQNSFIWLVNTGRSFGIASIISTQRPANIDKRIIAPAEWKLLLKANMPNDLAVYSEFGLEKDIARKLDVGQAHIVGPGEFSEGAIYQIGKRQSPDAAKSPGVANLRKRSSQQIEEIEDEEDIDALISSMPEVDPKDTRDDGRTHWSLGNSSVVRSPYYEQTVYSEVNPRNSAYNPLNGSTSAHDRQQTRLINEDINGDPEHAEGPDTQLNVNGKVDTSKVSAEKREFIKRLAAMGIINHRDIAKAAKLDGPKYAIYKQVCAEEGIEIK